MVRAFAWPGMKRDVRVFVRECDSCQRHKHLRVLEAGEARTQELPSRPWEFVGVDFIGPLNPSEGFDRVAVVLCLLTKMVHLVPCYTTDTARETARWFARDIVRLHGIPSRLISDRDTLFTSTFWDTLWECLGTKLSMSSAYHPQSDGAVERHNAVFRGGLAVLLERTGH